MIASDLLAYHARSAPAIVPDIIVASEAARRALIPNRDRSACRWGAIPPIPPIWMAMELKFAKPHKAYVDIMIDFSDRKPLVFMSARLL